MIVGFGSRRPERFKLGDQLAHVPPIAQFGLILAVRHMRKPGGMVESLAQGYQTFTLLGEVGPVFGDGGVISKNAPISKHMDHRGGDTLCRGEDGEKRVCVDLDAFCRIRQIPSNPLMTS